MKRVLETRLGAIFTIQSNGEVIAFKMQTGGVAVETHIGADTACELSDMFRCAAAPARFNQKAKEQSE